MTVRHTRIIRLAAAALVTVNIAGAGAVLGIRAQDDPTPLAVEAAIERYRTATTSAATPAPADLPDPTEIRDPVEIPGANPPPAAASTPTPTGHPNPMLETAAPSRSLIEPGVYIYDTTGYEEVDALGGARHDYPAETTITYEPAECGMTERWAPLTQRADTRLLCPSPEGDVLHWFHTAREFFGQHVGFTFRCPDGPVVRPTEPSPGHHATSTCSADNGDETTITVTTHDPAPVTIDGTTIQATRIELQSEASGQGHARSTIEMLLHPNTGLVLARTVATDAEGKSPAGPTRYTERYAIQLRSLEPAS